jgi:serine/threonine protein kinase
LRAASAALSPRESGLWAGNDPQYTSGVINQAVSHYRVQELIGEGGMGVVYKALDTRLDRAVALKFLSEQSSREPQALERFRLEARAASALNHPQICTIYDIGEHNGQPFIVMEFLEGESLKERIPKGPIPTDQLLDISIQISGALEAAHAKGIIHRDIKPGNLFLTKHGQVKILDFGLAKLAPREVGLSESTTLGSSAKTTAGTVVGTVAYMSPEQARAEEVDSRSDLFSVGVVLYEMATGQQAFAGPTVAVVFDSLLNRDPAPPARLNVSIPSQLDHTIQKALEKDRKMRYQHCSELRTDLERLRRDWLAGRSTSVQIRDVTPVSTMSTMLTATAADEETAEAVGGRSPKVAFMLGFIPGVGALYNAQYKKAAAQIVIFGLLSALGNAFDNYSIESLFSYLLFGFYAYMVFDSYHTAKLRSKRNP